MLPQSAVIQIKEANKEDILAKPNVVGVGVGYRRVAGVLTGELSVIVLVRQKLPVAGLDPGDLLPQRLENIDVDVIQVGEIRALQARTDRWRPAPGGVSLGHYKITAGTFGAVVRDRGSGERLILSNNHVLANSNEAAPGDPILQPGPYDGGDQDNELFARLERFVHRGHGTVARHAVGVDHFHPLHKRRGGAHAGGIDLADEHLGPALVPEPEAMRDLSGRHGDGAEVESGFAGLQPAGCRGGGNRVSHGSDCRSRKRDGRRRIRRGYGPAAGLRDENRDRQADCNHGSPQGQIPVHGTFRCDACVACHGTLLSMPFEKICMSCRGDYAR